MAIFRQLAHAFAAVDVDALIETAPQPAHHAIGDADRFIGEVGGDLFHHLDGVLLRLLMGKLFTARLFFHRFFNRLGLQQLVEEILTRRQTRADRG